MSAVDAARVSAFLPALSDGLDTNVGESGSKLSGGQVWLLLSVVCG